MEIESTDLMLQLVTARRGVTVLPDWLLREDAKGMLIRTLRIGSDGLHKSINLGMRIADSRVDFLNGLLAMASHVHP
ncbi:hypothetical protein E0K89_019475 [Aquicoccus sp. SCR17]|nr:hypothetical protein [Carideicomes alvinocaridis]